MKMAESYKKEWCGLAVNGRYGKDGLQFKVKKIQNGTASIVMTEGELAVQDLISVAGTQFLVAKRRGRILDLQIP